MSKKILRITFAILMTSCLVQASGDTCKELISEHKTDVNLSNVLKNDESLLKSLSTNLDCLDSFVRVNFFQTAKLLLEDQFGSQNTHNSQTGKALSKAQSVVQSAIQYVKDQQEEILQIFESTQQMSSYSDSIPIIVPSMRWAQSVDNTFVEVKFATRFDSPACLDIFDHVTTLNDRTLSISAMCRNDKKLLKYQMQMELSGDVAPFVLPDETLIAYETNVTEYNEKMEKFNVENATFTEEMVVYNYQKVAYDEQQETLKDEDDINEDEHELLEKPKRPRQPAQIKEPVKPMPSIQEMQSVGRMLLTLAKTDAPSRWRKMSNDQGLKKANVQVWWELHEKYEDSLVKLKNFDAEDDDVEAAEEASNSDSDQPKKKKNKKKKSKKNKKDSNTIEVDQTDLQKEWRDNQVKYEDL